MKIALMLFVALAVVPLWTPSPNRTQARNDILGTELLTEGCSGTANRACADDFFCVSTFSAYCERCSSGCCDCIETFSLQDFQNFQDKGSAVELQRDVEKATARSAQLVTTAAFGLEVGDAVLQINGYQVSEERFKEIRMLLERGAQVIVKAYRTTDGSGKILTIALKLQ